MWSEGYLRYYLGNIGFKLQEKYELDADLRCHPNIWEAVQSHIEICNAAKFLDFLLWVFVTESWASSYGQRGVDEINKILREEGIGYEFSPYVVNRTSRIRFRSWIRLVL